MSAIESDRLNEVILAVDGVVEAFPPPSIPRLIATAANGGDVAASITPTHDGLRVEARIATRLDGRSADSARAVADAILLGYAEPEAQIRIQIARIH